MFPEIECHFQRLLVFNLSTRWQASCLLLQPVNRKAKGRADLKRNGVKFLVPAMRVMNRRRCDLIVLPSSGGGNLPRKFGRHPHMATTEQIGPKIAPA